MRAAYNIGDRVLFLKQKIFREGVIVSYKAPYYLIVCEKYPIPFSVRTHQIQCKRVDFEMTLS